MEKSECKWLGDYYIHTATGKALCVLRHEYDQIIEEHHFSYLLTDGKMKRQKDMLDDDVREIVNQFCDSEGSGTLEHSWDIKLTKAEKLTNLLLGNQNNEEN